MSEFTISSASTIMACQFPFRDDVVMPPEASTDPARELGAETHDCAAKFINSARHVESLDPAKHAVWASARAWIVSHWRQTWVAEPAYVWDPIADTARRIGVDIARAYDEHGRLPHETGGTLDVCSVEGDTVYVYEFGTGYDVSHKHEQMRLQCAVAALAHGCARAVGQVIRFADDAAYPQMPIEFDEFDLAAIRGEFAEYRAKVEGSEAVPGDHCKRCNLAPVCPAAATIVTNLIPIESLVRPGWGLTIANADHARWLLDHARLVAAAADAVKEAVNAYVPKDGLLLSDGCTLTPSTRNMPRKNHARIEALARALGATDEQIESCTVVVVENAGLKVKKPAKVAKPRKVAA